LAETTSIARRSARTSTGSAVAERIVGEIHGSRRANTLPSRPRESGAVTVSWGRRVRHRGDGGVADRRVDLVRGGDHDYRRRRHRCTGTWSEGWSGRRTYMSCRGRPRRAGGRTTTPIPAPPGRRRSRSTGTLRPSRPVGRGADVDGRRHGLDDQVDAGPDVRRPGQPRLGQAARPGQADPVAVHLHAHAGHVALRRWRWRRTAADRSGARPARQMPPPASAGRGSPAPSAHPAGPVPARYLPAR